MRPSIFSWTVTRCRRRWTASPLQTPKGEIPQWTGTTTELRAHILSHAPESDQKHLPKSDRGLIGALRRLLPGLRARRGCGTAHTGTRRRTPGKRVITIRWGDSDDLFGAKDEAPPPPPPPPPSVFELPDEPPF